MSDSSIWTEKYRPQTFNDLKGQEEVVKRVKALVEQKNIPHMLFSGPAGIGKTTLALIIVKQLYGKDWKQNFLELNASDARGIDTIRNDVKDFAKTKSISEISYKIIFLDECDALTKEAQQALRRTMETYSESCRFILSCNFPSKIIDPIKSRCAAFKFRPLTNENIRLIIEEISKKENLKLDENTIDLLYEYTGGDVRQLQNIIQSTSAHTKEISKETLSAFINSIESKDIEEIITLAINKKFIESRKKLLDTMLNNGIAGIEIIKQIQREVLKLSISDEKKLEIVEKCGEIEFRLVEGSDDYVQLESLLAFMAR